MGIPCKGSRKVEVGGKPYLYLIKETNIENHHDQWGLTVTVQEDCKKPGGVLQVIEEALKRGWDPNARGQQPFQVSTRSWEDE